jgi:5-methylcytosine-specific restriction protein B
MEEVGRMPESGAHAIYATASLFSERAVERGTSLLWPDRDAWTVENIDELLDAFIANPDEGSGTFIEKWHVQLATRSEDVHCVAADALTFYFLFPDNIGADTKLTQLDTVASWKLGTIPERALLPDAFAGIGLPGLHYMTGRPWQIAYFLVFGRGAIAAHTDMHDPEAVRLQADSAKDEVRALKQKTAKNPHYQMHEGEAARNVLLHLLFPADFEAIASEAHRHDILQRYSALAPGVTDADAALALIRSGLAPRFGPGFDFYRQDVRSEWDPDARQPLRYWVEKTQVAGRPDRAQGSLAFGQALWSPQEDNRGGDTYRFMRDVADGDVVLHLQDHEAITAFSRAASAATGDFVCPPNTEWAGRPGFMTRLKNFTKLDPALARQAIFSSEFAGRLLDLLEAGTKTLFYNRDLALDQDTYLTPAPAELVDVLDDAYQALSGHTLTSLIIVGAPPDVLQDLVEATYLTHADLQDLIDLLEDKQQVILEGPPGAGKTYVAEHIARHLTGNPLKGPHNDRLRVVQFHQSYGYEDFIQGIRPETRDGHIEYHVRDGVFKDFVQRAAKDRENKYVMLIDEINRGNMSRIFGELLYLLEYRDKTLTLPSSDDEEATPVGAPGEFSIPDNVYIIATMNTADRSLAQLDYALRRRFYFYRLSPVSRDAAPVLEAWLTAQRYPADVRHLVLKLFLALNERLARELGDDYLVGHSYMMRGTVETDAGRRAIWKHSVLPLLAEYFYNRPSKAILDTFTIDALLGE